MQVRPAARAADICGVDNPDEVGVADDWQVPEMSA